MKNIYRMNNIVIWLTILSFSFISFLILTASFAWAQTFHAKINFQNESATPPSGWIKDYGQAYGAKNSLTYGWVKADGSRTPLDLVGNGRNRNVAGYTLLDNTLMHMQYDDLNNTNGVSAEGRWEVKLPEGNYKVTIKVGDTNNETFAGTRHVINIEGVKLIDYKATLNAVNLKSTVNIFKVTDGNLTVSATGGTNTKITTVQVEATTADAQPRVLGVNIANGATGVGLLPSITSSNIYLPNAGIDPLTLNNTTVKLYRVDGSNLIDIPSTIGTSGGFDVISLTPKNKLLAYTKYKFVVTSAVKDQSGVSFIAFSSFFTTGSGSSTYTGPIAFVDRTTVASGGNGLTSLVIGPDDKLYALSSDGFIKRWHIDHQTGLLSNEQVISTIRNAAGGVSRLAVGMTFDPAATASNLVLWVSHSKYGFSKQPDFQGKISRLSGANLQNIQDYVIHLPRSTKDHVTNGISFGPDGALYILQGSNSAMGAYDNAWQRNEVLLAGALLRLDVNLIKSKNLPLPINVQTEQGNNYNPYTTGAPLTLYATGIRNAYDMLWHSNGQLYVPANGSAGLANAPGSDPASLNYVAPQYKTYAGPVVPYVSGIPSQKDYVFRIVKGGYYGHPNPRRAQYVLNGGNPATSSWPEAVVSEYPAGTAPDANYRGYSESLGLNKSPNGVIEYKSSSFNGALAGKLINVWFTPNKIVVMEPATGAPYDIAKVIEGIPGFSSFNKPLDIVEDTKNGNLYISEYQYSSTNLGGTGKITLLKPDEPPGSGSIAVWLEAECGSVGSNWLKLSDASASGGAYLTVKSGYNSLTTAPANAADKVSLSFNISKTGSYYLSARVKAATSSDNSFWVRIDGGSWLLWSISPLTSTFSWRTVQNSPFSFSAGSHTLDIAYREDGTHLDKVYISSSSSLPTGTGQTAANCGTTARLADEGVKSSAAEEHDLEDREGMLGDMAVYPNPSTGLFELSLDKLAWEGKGHVLIYNLQGGIIKELKFEDSLPQEIILDLRDQAEGTYILQIKSGKITFVTRLIKGM